MFSPSRSTIHFAALRYRGAVARFPRVAMYSFGAKNMVSATLPGSPGSLSNKFDKQRRPRIASVFLHIYMVLEADAFHNILRQSNR